MTTPAPPTQVLPPTPPQSTDTLNFDARADAFVAWFPTAWAYLTAFGAWMTARANEVQANSTAATQAAATSAAVAASPAVQNAAANASAAQLAAMQAQAYATQAQAVSPDSPVRLNTRRITATLAIATGYNAHSVGPISIDDGVAVTIAQHSTWSIT
jgi:hypothetical protein